MLDRFQHQRVVGQIAVSASKAKVLHQPLGGFMPRVGQDIGSALSAYARARWPRDTAKQMALAWRLDPETARNTAKGHAGPRVLAKAIATEGYDVLDAIGEAVVGKSRIEWERLKLQRIQGELDNAKTEYEAMVRRAEKLKASLSELPPGRRHVVSREGSSEGG